MKIDLRSALILAVAAAFTYGCGGDGEDAKESSAMAAHDFTVTAIGGEGETISLSDYKGKVLILDFWATWCGPCRREIPHFNELYSKYNKDGLEILGVSVDRQGPGVVQKFMESTPLNYPSAMASPEMQSAYGPIESIPTTFIIDRKGRLQTRFIGYRDITVFEEVLGKLL